MAVGGVAGTGGNGPAGGVTASSVVDDWMKANGVEDLSDMTYEQWKSLIRYLRVEGFVGLANQLTDEFKKWDKNSPDKILGLQSEYNAKKGMLTLLQTGAGMDVAAALDKVNAILDDLKTVLDFTNNPTDDPYELFQTAIAADQALDRLEANLPPASFEGAALKDLDETLEAILAKAEATFAEAGLEFPPPADTDYSDRESEAHYYFAAQLVKLQIGAATLNGYALDSELMVGFDQSKATMEAWCSYYGTPVEDLDPATFDTKDMSYEAQIQFWTRMAERARARGDEGLAAYCDSRVELATNYFNAETVVGLNQKIGDLDTKIAAAKQAGDQKEVDRLTAERQRYVDRKEALISMQTPDNQEFLRSLGRGLTDLVSLRFAYKEACLNSYATYCSTQAKLTTDPELKSKWEARAEAVKSNLMLVTDLCRTIMEKITQFIDRVI